MGFVSDEFHRKKGRWGKRGEEGRMGLKKKGRTEAEREGRRKERKFKKKERRSLITENFRTKNS